jgi:hypothetical protein
MLKFSLTNFQAIYTMDRPFHLHPKQQTSTFHFFTIHMYSRTIRVLHADVLDNTSIAAFSRFFIVQV